MPHGSKYCYRVLWVKISSWYIFFSPRTWYHSFLKQLPEGIQGIGSTDSILEGQEQIRMEGYRKDCTVLKEQRWNLRENLEGHLNDITRRKTENNTANTEASRHSELWRNTHISLVILCSSPCLCTERRSCNVLLRRDFSALKALKWSCFPCVMLLHQKTEQVFYKHLRRQHKAQYVCKKMMNFGCERHMPPEFLLK